MSDKLEEMRREMAALEEKEVKQSQPVVKPKKSMDALFITIIVTVVIPLLLVLAFVFIWFLRI